MPTQWRPNITSTKTRKPMLFGKLGLELMFPKCKVIPAAKEQHEICRDQFDDFIWIDGVAINGVECECSACQYSRINAHHDWNMTSCAFCGCVVAEECVEYIDNKEYCGEVCAEEHDN